MLCVICCYNSLPLKMGLPGNNSSSQRYGDWPESPGPINATIIIILAALINVVNLWTLLVTRSYRHALNSNILISCFALVAYISSWTICPLIAYIYLASDSLSSVTCDVFDAFWTFYQLISNSRYYSYGDRSLHGHSETNFLPNKF